jgi:hypothetical protein
VDAGITGSDGLIDVNPYTLQHERFENIFAWGDAIRGNITRSQTAATAQCPVVKNNVLRFMEGKECNGVYDGYSYWPMLMSYSHAVSFSHLHDYEPHPNNHWQPGFGLLGNRYYHWQANANKKAGGAMMSLDKNHGPPYKHFSQTFDELEHNTYLQAKGVNVDALKSIHSKSKSVAV